MSNKTAWWKKSVVYQVYPKSFCDSNGDGIGDLNGIRKKIPYLAKLGVDVLWLNPIYASPQVDNGYDISNYREIEPTFGTMEDFGNLLAEAHEAGLKIILDLVVNHTSDQHPWFQESRKSKDNPYSDYYIWKDEVINNWGSSFGGSAWEYAEERAQYYLHCFAKEQPDLNWENPKVRQEVYDILRFWLDKGIDGFRMDVISLLSKDQSFPDGPVIQNKAYGSYYAGCANGPRVHEFLQEMNREVLSKYDIMTVGETPHTNADEAALYTDESRKELNMVFHFDHMHLDYDENGKYATNRVPLVALKKVMTQWQDKMHECNGWNSLYWCNHDQARAVTRFGNDSEEYREISAKMLGTCLHMMQGTPYIYQGEELGMTNVQFDSIEEYEDIETLNMYKERLEKGYQPEEIMQSIYARSRDNARTPMQWSGEKNGGFTTGEPWFAVNPNYTRINAKEAQEDENSVFYYYQKLIRLRKENPVFVDGKFDLLLPEDEKIFTYTRTDEHTKMLVCANFTDEEVSCPLLDEWKDGEVWIRNYEDDREGNVLRPYEAVIIGTAANIVKAG